MACTIKAQTPAPPAWIKRAGKEAVWAWNNWLHWRCDAAEATTAQYRHTLIQRAKHASGK